MPRPPKPRPANYPKGNVPWPITDRGITWDDCKAMFDVRVTFEGKLVRVGRFEALSHAREALKIARGEIAAKTFVPPAERRAIRKLEAAQFKDAAARDSLTVRVWAREWLARPSSTKGEPLSPGSISSYRSCLNNHVLPYLGDKPLASVTRSDIDALLSGRLAGKAPANTAGTIRAMFRAAQQKGQDLQPNVLSDVKVKKSNKRKTLDDDVVLSQLEVQLIAAKMLAPYGLAVELAAWCALRMGEVQGLQRRDVDLENATVKIRRQWKPKYESERRKNPELFEGFPTGWAAPKNKSYGEVPISNPDLIRRLRGHLEVIGEAPDTLLFPSPQTKGAPISEATLLKRYRDGAGEAGITRALDFHTLRHTGATWYGRTGAPVASIMKFGRWQDPASAMRYQHADAENVRYYGNKMMEAA